MLLDQQPNIGVDLPSFLTSSCFSPLQLQLSLVSSCVELFLSATQWNGQTSPTDGQRKETMCLDTVSIVSYDLLPHWALPIVPKIFSFFLILASCPYSCDVFYS